MSQQINLFNPAFLPQKKHFSAATMLQALALISAGTIAFAGYAAYQVRSLARLAAASEKPLIAQRDQLAALAKELGVRGQSTLLQEELARTEAQVKSRRELLASLQTGMLGNVQGFSRYLAAFARQRTEGVWLTGISLGGDENDLVVRGRALRADLLPPYLRALNQQEVMRGRRVTELRLSAFQEPAATVAPGQPGAGSAAPAGSRRPARFVEFTMLAPRHAADAPKAEPVDPRRRTAS